MKIATHNGDFHADDVFAVATIFLAIKGKREVFRTRDQKIIENSDFVIDVGGKNDGVKNFDHHQKDGGGVRENNIPYASFGLVWKKFGEKICGSKEVADNIDVNLVMPIDAVDNGFGEIKPIFEGVYTYGVAQALDSFNPSWKEKKYNSDKVFLGLVNFALKILKREIKKTKDLLKGQKFVEKVYKKTEDKRIIILDEEYPYQEVLKKYNEPLLVVSPAGENWKVKVVSDNPLTFKNRILFPESWAGKNDRELAEVAGVSDAVFCHRARFIAVAKSKDGAIELAKLTLQVSQKS